MKQYFLALSGVCALGLLVGCAPMTASVPQQTANIGGMHSTSMNPIENSNGPTVSPMENANKMISY